MPLVRFLVVGLAKLLSKLFGLATVTFFGRMPSRDSDKMALVALLSVTWLAAVAALVPPDVVAPLPWVPRDEASRRLLALGAVLALPVVNGAIISRVHNRDGGLGDTLRQVTAGYLHTAIIGAVVVATALVVPIVKANYLVRRFESQHLMVMIPQGDYDDAYEHLLEPARAPRRLPPALPRQPARALAVPRPGLRGGADLPPRRRV